MSSPTQTSVLAIRGLKKAFAGIPVLKGVDLTVGAGEIHALMGENGAGKSTVIKLINGFYSIDDGTIAIGGKEIAPSSPSHAQKLGISTVFQEVNLIPALSIGENIFLGREPRKLGLIQWGEVHRRSREILKTMGLDLDTTQPVCSQSIAIQQMVAIARALDMSAQVLILDEPTSSLDSREVETLFALMRKLKSQGLAIIFVSHFLDQVFEICDSYTVLRNGEVVDRGLIANTTQSQMVGKMMGRELEAVTHSANPTGDAADRAQALVETTNLGRTGSVQNLNLRLRKGEITGLAGLLGSGRTEVMRMLFGLDAKTEGAVKFEGKEVSFSSPRQALKSGFALLPEDRKRQGVFKDLSVRENLILALQARNGWMRLSKTQRTEMVEKLLKAVGAGHIDPEKEIGLLSGGNQQKVLLARWIATQPQVLLLDEPTRGIDVGAKAEILTQIRALRDEGKAILMASSDLEDMLNSCDRMTVLRERRKVAEFSGDEIIENNVLHAMAEGNKVQAQDNV